MSFTLPTLRRPTAGSLPAASERQLQYYKIGLAAIALFTVILVIMVLAMASGAKQDIKTQKAASQTATKLEDYINNNQVVPDTLGQADISSDNKAISYKKLSDTSYRFCVTYKTASSGYDSASITDAVNRGLKGAYSSSLSNTVNSSTSYLYIGPTHKKGENCQTVTPYISGYSTQGSSLNDSATPSAPAATDPKAAAATAALKDGVCYFTGYSTHYAGVVSSVTNAGPGAYSGAQTVTIKVKPAGGSPVGEQTLTLDVNVDNLFDANCISQYTPTFAVGDYVAVFLNNSDKYTSNTVINFSYQQ